MKYGSGGRSVTKGPTNIADSKTSTASAGIRRNARSDKKPVKVRQRYRLPATRKPLRAKNIGRIIAIRGRAQVFQTRS